MDRFRVWLKDYPAGEPTRWVFYSAEKDFPEEFQGFDDGRERHERVVWVGDTVQALVACDWLKERGWVMEERKCSSTWLQVWPGFRSPWSSSNGWRAPIRLKPH